MRSWKASAWGLASSSASRWKAGSSFQKSPRLSLHQPFLVERQPKRAPAKRWILFLLRHMFQIWKRLVTADVNRAEHHRLFASGFEDFPIETLLPFTLWQGC